MDQKISNGPRQTINVTYLGYGDNGTTTKYSSKREVGLNEPLRKTLLLVVNESIQKNGHAWLAHADDDESLIVYLDGGAESAGAFGIRYGVNEDGSLQYLNGYTPLRRDWTLSELHQLKDDQLIKGDEGSVIVADTQGLGAVGNEEIALVLNALAYIGNVYGGLSALTMITLFVTRRIRQAKKWKERGFYGLRQIRELVDEKSVWHTQALMKYLATDEKFATNILSKLGYELHGNEWKIGQSQQALQERSKWLAKEEEIETKLTAKVE